MGAELSEQEQRWLSSPRTPEGAAFRAGARCEARSRDAATASHRDLVDCVQVLAEHHAGLSDVELVDTVARVFVSPDGAVQWAVDCPVEGLVLCDSEQEARAWLTGADPHPGEPDRLLTRVVLPWREVPRG